MGASCPIHPSYDNDKDIELLNKEQAGTYLSILGNLQMIAHRTRPDFSTAVSNLRTLISSPAKKHYDALTNTSNTHDVMKTLH